MKLKASYRKGLYSAGLRQSQGMLRSSFGVAQHDTLEVFRTELTAGYTPSLVLL